MSELSEHSYQADESAWLYMAGPVSAPELAAAMTDLCHEVGWGLYHPRGAAGEARQRLDALRYAHAVIADLFADDAQTLADLDNARQAGRPILALQPARQPASAKVRELLDGYERMVTLTCADADECLERTRQTLTDESWRVLVREAFFAADA